jgi:hypothetical protein
MILPRQGDTAELRLAFGEWTDEDDSPVELESMVAGDHTDVLFSSTARRKGSGCQPILARNVFLVFGLRFLRFDPFRPCLHGEHRSQPGYRQHIRSYQEHDVGENGDHALIHSPVLARRDPDFDCGAATN